MPFISCFIFLHSSYYILLRLAVYAPNSNERFLSIGFIWCWDLNPGLPKYYTDTLPLSHIASPKFLIADLSIMAVSLSSAVPDLYYPHNRFWTAVGIWYTSHVYASLIRSFHGWVLYIWGSYSSCLQMFLISSENIVKSSFQVSLKISKWGVGTRKVNWGKWLYIQWNSLLCVNNAW